MARASRTRMVLAVTLAGMAAIGLSAVQPSGAGAGSTLSEVWSSGDHPATEANEAAVNGAENVPNVAAPPAIFVPGRPTAAAHGARSVDPVADDEIAGPVVDRDAGEDEGEGEGGDEHGQDAAASVVDPYSTNLLVNRSNGAVQLSPRVYVVFWGDWTANADRSGVANRLMSFYRAVGGTRWAGVATQYRQGCTPGTTRCSGAAAGNPANVLRGAYTDSTPVPTTPTQEDIRREALKLASFVGDRSYNAQYVVALPAGHGDTLYKAGRACAWHSATYTDVSNWVTYTALPYQLDSVACGLGARLPGTAGSALDPISVVAGHEYTETVTDPGLNAWLDSAGEENADKCVGLLAAVALADGRSYAMQSTWSNASRLAGRSGCVFT